MQRVQSAVLKVSERSERGSEGAGAFRARFGRCQSVQSAVPKVRAHFDTFGAHVVRVPESESEDEEAAADPEEAAPRLTQGRRELARLHSRRQSSRMRRQLERSESDDSSS